MHAQSCITRKGLFIQAYVHMHAHKDKLECANEIRRHRFSIMHLKYILSQYSKIIYKFYSSILCFFINLA